MIDWSSARPTSHVSARSCRTRSARRFAAATRCSASTSGGAPALSGPGIGTSTRAQRSTKAKRAGRVTLTLKATKKLARRLARDRGKTLMLTVAGPGGTTKLTRKLR